MTENLLKLRKAMRLKFRKSEEHPIRNMFHCSDSQLEAIREASIFFGAEELLKLVGCSEDL